MAVVVSVSLVNVHIIGSMSELVYPWAFFTVLHYGKEQELHIKLYIDLPFTHNRQPFLYLCAILHTHVLLTVHHICLC